MRKGATVFLTLALLAAGSVIFSYNNDTGWEADTRLYIFRTAFDDVTFQEMATPPPTTCAGAKTTSSLGDPVDLQGVVVTLAQFDAAGGKFGHVEDSNRVAGIRIYEPPGSYLWDIFSLGVGSNVDAAGILEINDDQELQVRITSISAAAGNEAIHPLAATNRSIGGGALGLQVGVENGVGPNNIGLLMRTWGKVTAIEPDLATIGDEFSIFIDDGSGLIGGVAGTTATHPGIEVKIPFGLSIDPDVLKTGSKYVMTTGAASIKAWDPGDGGTLLKPLILIRDDNDIQYSEY